MPKSERRTFFSPAPSLGGYIVDPVDDTLFRLQSARYDAPRGLVGAAKRIDLSKQMRVNSRTNGSSSWQHAAYDYLDRVGELQSVALLVAHLVSRAMVYAAVVKDPSAVPVSAEDILNDTDGKKDPEVEAACELAIEALAELFANGQSGLLDRMAMNLFVVGDGYLVNTDDEWTFASVDEITIGNPTTLKRTRTGGDIGGTILPIDAYVTRLWRPHPRWYNDPFSSVLGVLDQLEMVVLFDQAMRHIARQRMNAGLITIPNNLATASGKTLYEAITEFTQQAVENESSPATVTPLILLKPPATANNQDSLVEWTEIGRKIDDELIKASQFAIDRVISGLDVPKDSVTGNAGVRYSNALVSSDALLRTHIEPLIILVCDLITVAYLKPYLKRNGVSAKIANQVVAWYNPANIVTRPDKSTAANEGLDRLVVSAKAWRQARGFTELDAPSDAEIEQRIKFNQAQSVQAIPTNPSDSTSGVNKPKPSDSGGDIPQGGTMPPR